MKLLLYYSCIARKPELKHVNKEEDDGVKGWLCGFCLRDLIDNKYKDKAWNA